MVRLLPEVNGNASEPIGRFNPTMVRLLLYV